MRKFLSTLITILLPTLISAQCWLHQGVQDLKNPELSTEFKALLKNSEYEGGYKLLHEQAFNLRTDVKILKKLKDNYGEVLADLKNVNEDFLKSDLVHLDLAGYNKYPESVKLVTASTLDDELTLIDNLLQGKIKDFTPKFKTNSVDRITLENAPYRDDILAEIKRVTKDGGSIELEHATNLNMPYNQIADKVGGGIKKTEKIVKDGFEYTRVTIIKGWESLGNLGNRLDEFPKLLEKLDEFPNLKSKFLDDFADASEVTINKIGNNPDLFDSWKALDGIDEINLSTDLVWLNRLDDWTKAELKLSRNGDKLKLLDGSDNVIAEIKNNELLAEVYDFDRALDKHKPGGESIGEIANGYQVYKHGDELSIRRVPDMSNYNSSQIAELTLHERAHVLERHGHDVTEKALIKRANEGWAPDGSNIGNPNSPFKPPYSSKFDTPDQLKLALENTRPGTDAFNSFPTENGTRVVYHELTNGTKYGRGVARDGNVFEDSIKVRAVYREVSPNNYQLLTMFPDF